MIVTVQTSNESVFKIEISDLTIFTDFRSKLAETSGYDVNKVRLFCLGKAITNELEFTYVRDMEKPNMLMSIGTQKYDIKPTHIKSIPHRKFEVCWILLLNCESCLNTYFTGGSLESRARINLAHDLPNISILGPTVFEFSILVGRLQKFYFDYHLVFKNCSRDLLDLAFPTENKARNIQLLMDTARYLSELDKILARFIIPVCSTDKYLKYYS